VQPSTKISSLNVVKLFGERELIRNNSFSISNSMILHVFHSIVFATTSCLDLIDIDCMLEVSVLLKEALLWQNLSSLLVGEVFSHSEPLYAGVEKHEGT